MLFEGWAFQFTNAWNDHPFRSLNNSNGIDADPGGRGLLYNQVRDDAMGKKVLALQEAYVRKVIDAVNDMDNVLYEVCNESGAYSTRWQYHLIDFIHKYEATQPKQHPVGMTFMYRDGTNQMLIDSPADWISPNPGTPDESYKDRPSARYVGKVVVNDTDHLWGHTGGDSVWVWKSFTRGLNVLFMEELLPSPTWQDSARVAMGQVRSFASKIDLAHMTPAPELCGTGYLLATREDASTWPIRMAARGSFRLISRMRAASMSLLWYDPTKSQVVPDKPITGGDRCILTTPFPGPAAVHLKRTE